MKKIFLLLAMAGTMAFTGCTIEDDGNDVIENNYTLEAEMIELTNVDFDATADYAALYDLGTPIEPADVVLVYRLAGTTTGGSDIWQLIPRTFYFDNQQELDYDFNFTRNDVELYIDFTSGLDPVTIPEFTQNQIFRLVIIPGYNNTPGGRKNMNFSNYKEVIKKYNIDESAIRTAVKK